MSKEPLYPHVPKSTRYPVIHPQTEPEVEIKRHYGIIVEVGGIMTKDVNLPDWGLSYVEYPPGQMEKYRDALMRGRIKIVKVTRQRVYFVE